MNITEYVVMCTGKTISTLATKRLELGANIFFCLNFYVYGQYTDSHCVFPFCKLQRYIYLTCMNSPFTK